MQAKALQKSLILRKHIFSPTLFDYKSGKLRTREWLKNPNNILVDAYGRSLARQPRHLDHKLFSLAARARGRGVVPQTAGGRGGRGGSPFLRRVAVTKRDTISDNKGAVGLRIGVGWVKTSVCTVLPTSYYYSNNSCPCKTRHPTVDIYVRDRRL